MGPWAFANIDPAARLRPADGDPLPPEPLPVFSATLNLHARGEGIDIITYLRYLDENPSVGGFDLGSLGPVSEGLFIWIFEPGRACRGDDLGSPRSPTETRPTLTKGMAMGGGSGRSHGFRGAEARRSLGRPPRPAVVRADRVPNPGFPHGAPARHTTSTRKKAQGRRAHRHRSVLSCRLSAAPVAVAAYNPLPYRRICSEHYPPEQHVQCGIGITLGSDWASGIGAVHWSKAPHAWSRGKSR